MSTMNVAEMLTESVNSNEPAADISANGGTVGVKLRSFLFSRSGSG